MALSLLQHNVYGQAQGSLVFMTKVFLTLATWLIMTDYLVNQKEAGLQFLCFGRGSRKLIKIKRDMLKCYEVSEVMIVKVNSSRVNLENTHHCFVQQLCKSTQNKINMLCQKNIHTRKDYIYKEAKTTGD